MLKDLAKSFAVYGLASSTSKFIGVFLVPIYTRVFSPEQYGVIDLISTVVALVSILGMVQLESAVSRYYFEIKEDEQKRLYVSTAFWTIVLFSGIWAVLVNLAATPVSLLLFKTDQYGQSILIAALIIPFSNIFSFLTVVMRYIKKPLVFTIFVTIQLLATVGISVWLVVYERIGVIGVFYGQLLGFVFVSGAMLFYLRFLLRFEWRWSVLKKFFRFSLPIVPAVAGNWANSYVNRFFILGYLSVADIGLYTVALKIASVFKLLGSAFNMAWGPFMWENFERPDHKETYKKVMKIVTVAVFSLVAVVSFFASDILSLMTTEAYSNAAPLIGILSFSIGLTIVVKTIGLGAGITERTEFNTLIYFGSVGMNIACLYVLVPSMGLIAVPFCQLISTTLLVGLSWWNSERLYYIGFSKVFFVVSYMFTFILVGVSLLINMSPFLKSGVFIGVCLLFTCLFFMGKNSSMSIGNG